VCSRVQGATIPTFPVQHAALPTPCHHAGQVSDLCNEGGASTRISECEGLHTLLVRGVRALVQGAARLAWYPARLWLLAPRWARHAPLQPVPTREPAEHPTPARRSPATPAATRTPASGISVRPAQSGPALSVLPLHQDAPRATGLTCSRCPSKPSTGQRLCASCHAEDMRRRRRIATQRGSYTLRLPS